MTVVVAVLSSMLAVAGLVILVAWARGELPRGESSTPASTGLWTTLVDKAALDRRDLVRVALGLAAGVVVAVYAGRAHMVVVLPLAFWGLPRLLGEPPQSDIELLQALDRWVRTMTATLSTGKSITDALRASARQAPPLLQEPLVQLVRRLDDRWTPGQALLAMADDLASADADAVLASLVLATQRGGNGAVMTLAALADTIQDRLRALREIETERAKPRIVVRQVTVVTLAVLGGALLFGRDFFAPYATPLGQAILTVLLTVYVLSLVALRRMTMPRRRERILRSAA